jgi:hypothetical protein
MTESEEDNSKENADKKKKEPLSLKQLSSHLDWLEKLKSLQQESTFSGNENSSHTEHTDDDHSLSQSPPPSRDKPVTTVKILEEYNQHWREMPTPDKLPEYYRVWLHWKKRSRNEKLPNKKFNDETE